MPIGFGLLGLPLNLKNLTTAEVDQLTNIDAAFFPIAQWLRLSLINQDLTTSSNVAFQKINIGPYSIEINFNHLQVKKAGAVLFGIETGGDVWVGNLNDSAYPFSVSAQTNDSRATSSILDNRSTILRMQCGGTNRENRIYFHSTGTATPDFKMTYRKDIETFRMFSDAFGELLTFVQNVLSIKGPAIFEDSVVINGRFDALGDSFIADVTNYVVADNIITVNAGESGAGITSGSSGIDFDRGTLPPYALLAKESDSTLNFGTKFYTLGYGTLSNPFTVGKRVTGGTSTAVGRIITDNGTDSMTLMLLTATNFTSGETITEEDTGETAVTTSIGVVTDSTKIVPTMQDTPVDRSIGFWNDTTKNIETPSGFLYNADGTVKFETPTVDRASVNFPNGIAPASPNIGDTWSDSTGNGRLLYKRGADVIDLADTLNNALTVRDESEFIQDSTHIFLEGKAYACDGLITITKKIVPPANSVSSFFGINGLQSGLNYVGSGSLFENAAFGAGFFFGFQMAIICGAGQVFDITGSADGFVLMDTVAFVGDINDMGFVKTSASTFHFCNIRAWKTGFVSDGSSGFTWGRNFAKAGQNEPNSKLITIRNAHGPIQIASNFFKSAGANESFLDIENTSSTTVGSAYGNSIDLSLGGSEFAPGSKDQSDLSWIFAINPGMPKSISVAYVNSLSQGALETTLIQNKIKRINAVYTEINKERFLTFSDGTIEYIGKEPGLCKISSVIVGNTATGVGISHEFYFAKGNSLNTIVSFADAGGGQVLVTTNVAHGYTSGDRILQEDTANYDNEYIITVISTTTYEITETFVITEIGSHYKAQLFTKSSNDFSGTGSNKNTSLVTQIPIEEHDVLFFSTVNISSGSSWETEDIQCTFDII